MSKRTASKKSVRENEAPLLSGDINEVNLAADLYKKKRALESVSSEIQSRLETSLQELQGEFDAKFAALSDEIQGMFKLVEDDGNGKKRASKDERKVFVPQDSLLSRMLDYEDENYKTIFNLFVTVLILWGLSLALDDFSRSQGIYHWELLTWGLWRDLEAFAKFWFLMFLASFAIVPLAHVATESRGERGAVSPNPAKGTIKQQQQQQQQQQQIGGNWFVYALSVAVCVLLQLSFFAYSTLVVQSASTSGGLFAVPLGLGFMCEQCRMSMKMHAYFREKLLWAYFQGKYSCRPRSSSMAWCRFFYLPAGDYFFQELAKFRYFHFAPTLVYRDTYPLTRRVRWSFIMGRLCEWCGIVYYAFCIFREVLPSYEGVDFVGKPISMVDFVKISFRAMAPAMFCMLFTHFLILHVVQNVGAELCRFADRSFYRDWWNSRTFSVFYRHWNGVVHDFIHCYLYTDLVEFWGLPKLASLLTSFIASAVIHEYIISIALGFFLPILGVLFSGPGLLFILLTKNQTNRLWNVFMWIMLATGNAFLMVLYIREYFCRARNSPPLDPISGKSWEELGFWDVVVPRTYRVQFYSSA